MHSVALNGDAADLSGLLERARRLQHLSRATEGLPDIALGLDQVESSSRALAARAAPFGAPQGPLRAQYLLAPAHVDANGITRALEAVEPRQALATAPATSTGDLEGQLRLAHDQSIVECIEEGRRSATADFRKAFRVGLHEAWDRRKTALLSELRAHDGADASVGRHSTAIAPVASSHADRARAPYKPGAADASLSGRCRSVIASFNAARGAGSSYDLLAALSAVFLDVDASATSRSTSTWRILTCLLRNQSPPLRRTVTESQLIRGALDYLEEHFAATVVDKELGAQAGQATLGGVPSVVKKVETFVRLRGGRARWPTLETPGASGAEVAIWAVLYYLLRAGHRTHARQYAAQHRSAFDASSPSFVAALGGWIDGSVTDADRTAVGRFFATRMRHNASVDPFKVVLHQLVARIDLHKKRHPGVTEKTEDWLWLQIALAGGHTDEAGSVTEKDALGDVGREVVKYGVEVFGNAYAHALLLTGCFEEAIAAIWQRPAGQLDAVHVAVVLAQYRLLRIADPHDTAELDILHRRADGQSSAIDYIRLLYRYYRAFDHDHPEAALQYICLMTLGEPGATGRADLQQAAQRAIRELVVSTRAYATLLGEIQPDGGVRAGAILGLCPLILANDLRATDYVAGLSRDVARCAEADSDVATAVLLYNLADEPDSVLRVLAHDLGRGLFDVRADNAAGGAGESAPAADRFAMAAAIVTHYQGGKRGGRQPNAHLLETCQTLLRLRKVAVAHQDGRWADVLQLMLASHVVPLDPAVDVAVLMRAADDLRNVDDSIARNLGVIMLATMTALYRLFDVLKQSPFGDQGRQAMMTEYRGRARTLMTLAGLLRLRIPGDIFGQLTRLDVYLH